MRLTSIENQTSSVLKRGSRRPTFCEEQNLTASFVGPSDKKRNFSIDHGTKVRKCSISIFSSENPHPNLKPRSPKSHRNSLLLCSGPQRKTSAFFPAPVIDKLNIYEPSDFESSEEESIEYEFPEEPDNQETIRETQNSTEVSGSNQEVRKLFHHMFRLWFYMFLLITRFVRFLCVTTRGLLKRIVGWVRTQADINLNTLVAFDIKPETPYPSYFFTSSDIRLAKKGKQKSMHHKPADKNTKPRLTRKISFFATPAMNNSSPEVARQRSNSCCPTVNDQNQDQSRLLSQLKQSLDNCQSKPSLGQCLKGQDYQPQDIKPTVHRLDKCFEAARFTEANISQRNHGIFHPNRHYESRVHDF